MARPAPWPGKAEIYGSPHDTHDPLLRGRGELAGSAITYQRTMVLQIPRIAMAGHVATNTSATSTATIPRIRQSMPDSEALNPVSGKSHSKEALRARPVWTVYSIARVKYTALPTSQPTTPTGNVGCSSRPAS